MTGTQPTNQTAEFTTNTFRHPIQRSTRRMTNTQSTAATPLH